MANQLNWSLTPTSNVTSGIKVVYCLPGSTHTLCILFPIAYCLVWASPKTVAASYISNFANLLSIISQWNPFEISTSVDSPCCLLSNDIVVEVGVPFLILNHLFPHHHQHKAGSYSFCSTTPQKSKLRQCRSGAP